MKRIFTALLLSFGLFASCSADDHGDKKTAAEAPENGDSKDTVIMMTSKGKMVIQLNPEKAPITVANFLKYVDEKHYDGTIFHRIIPGFMVQGGGFDETRTQKKTNPPIKLEADNGLKNERGTISMARTGVRDSATSQFFLNVQHNRSLDTQYAVFGKVIEGETVIDEIIKQPRGVHKLTSQGGARPSQDVPNENIVINWVRRK